MLAAQPVKRSGHQPECPPSERRRPVGLFPGQSTPRLYERRVGVLRTRHYRRRSAEAYLHRTRRFLVFHGGALARGNDVTTMGSQGSEVLITTLISAVISLLKRHATIHAG